MYTRTFNTAYNVPITSKPKAYLNWILLDEQLQYVASYPQSGAIPIGNYAAGTLGTPGYSGIPVTKNGYLYIYVANETQGWDVFFDNLSIKHYTGAILEETHYYPFGLTMSGISSKALKSGYAENKYKYNKGSELQNKEFSDGSGLELYATPLRSLDPQLGRWWQIDSKPDYAQSLYSSMNNNPISFNDVLGDSVWKTQSVIYAPGGVSIPVTVVHVTGVVKNLSSKNLSLTQLGNAAQRIQNSLNSNIKGSDKNGIILADAKIGVSNQGQSVNKSDHVFSLYDKNKIPSPIRSGAKMIEGTQGVADYGQKGVALNVDLLNYSPTNEGKYTGTGLGINGEATLERTASHEFGHTVFGIGHSDEPCNLMQQSLGPQPGTDLNRGQLDFMMQTIENIQNGSLQSKRQFYDF